ncbi:unnamed protein product, partial [Ectocarpus sp. 4 AP-2014]
LQDLRRRHDLHLSSRYSRSLRLLPHEAEFPHQPAHGQGAEGPTRSQACHGREDESEEDGPSNCADFFPV